MHRAIPRAKVSEAVSLLSRKHQVVAAVPKGKSFVFAAVTEPSLVTLDYPSTILPLKKFFLPPTDVIFTFDRKSQEIAVPKGWSQPTVFFGIHNYELQGLLRLDHAFSSGVRDETWLERRRDSIFVGVTYEPDACHFADSVGIPTRMKDGFDVFLTRFDDHYRVESLTDKGKSIEAAIKETLVDCDCPGDPVVHFKNALRQSVAGIRETFHGAYNHPVWKETARKCHSCGTCNVCCPTCYCFDVDDQIVLGTEAGSRVRTWDSCQFLDFTKVAGGEAFRDKRHDRVRHRMSRKFAYITDATGQPFCVGCGRCVRQCTAQINIVDVMNALL
ncbi:MAG TPA: 4Fe-4S dicluster domain-containing protein [Spirochaetia bacterium]|nr:4Fe-4S dicluster domain-containing protein [Spirochaetia bacterium]